MCAKIAVFLLLVSLTSVLAKTDIVLCYYGSWAADNSGQGKFKPSDIDVNICTHVTYSFLGINSDGSLRLDGSDSILKQLSDLKKLKSSLKVLISVGGWSEGSKKFSDMAGSSSKLKTFVNSVMDFVKKYNCDGVDIDWEYPTQRGGTSNDKKNFVTLLKTLKSSLGNKILTTAVSSEADSKSYDIKGISQNVDYINVMTYDFHDAGEGKTGQNSPLYASSKDSQWEKENANVDASIKNWLKGGAPANKILLGLAFYGHSFTLKDSNQHNLGSPTKGEGKKGSLLKTAGTLGYNEICVDAKSWTRVFDEEQKVPYKYQGDQWVGYDDPQSIALKVQYAKKQNLAGVMMWSVDTDDLHGNCGTKNGLLKTIKENL